MKALSELQLSGSLRLCLAAIIAAVALGSCADSAFNLDRPRMYCEGRNPGNSGEKEDSDSSGSIHPTRYDTTLYFCAVSFDSGYAWQRDTAYGSVGYELIFYKDFKPILRLRPGSPRCFSADFDTHHIIGGNLYTEYSDMSSSYVGRNGELQYTVPAREFLRGLVPVDGSIHTLSQPRSGGGFVYRVDGALVEEFPTDTLYGNFLDPSYGATGALYRKNGMLYYCHRSADRQNRKYWFCEDGSHRSAIGGLYQPEYVLDLKFCTGGSNKGYTTYLAPGSPRSGFYSDDQKLWDLDTGVWTAGYFSDRTGRTSFTGHIITYWNEVFRICYEQATPYLVPGGGYAVADNAASGSVSLWSMEGWHREFPGCRMMSAACAAPVGDKLLVGMSPREEGGRPLVFFSGRETSVDINGYISCVWGEIRPR